MTLTSIIAKIILYAKRAIVSDNSSSSAVDITQAGTGEVVKITQTGTGDILSIENTTNTNATPITINTLGTLIKGDTQSQIVAGADHGIQLNARSVTRGASMSLLRYNNDTFAPQISFAKGRGTSSSFGLVASGDELGQIKFAADNGQNYTTTPALIRVEVDGATSSSSIPTAMRFFTGTNNSPSENLTIRSNGNVGINESSPQATLHVDGTVRLDVSSSTTVGAAGPASALPATPEGYMVININGTNRKIPFYAL